MVKKSKQIQQLIDYLLKKYDAEIFVTDYWDADETAIGLANISKTHTVYISDYGKKEAAFFVSLEYPPTSDEFPYTPGEDFENCTIIEVENILVKHLKIS